MSIRLDAEVEASRRLVQLDRVVFQVLDVFRLIGEKLRIVQRDVVRARRFGNHREADAKLLRVWLTEMIG
ncbi:MAG: hypothetical protein R3E58_00020 [Phycisphaerae bacterium]